MNRFLFCLFVFALFSSGSSGVKNVSPQIKEVEQSVDDFAANLDKLEVSAQKLNKALK